MSEAKPVADLVSGDQLRTAVLQAAMPDAQVADTPLPAGLENKPETPKKRRVGDGTPGPGRPKGSVPKVVKTVREAVMEAFHQVGGAAYLVRLAEGTQSDRAAFTSLLNKVLPTQLNANIDGAVKLELSWLGQRNIGASASQPVEQVTQVIDLERDKRGKYRIADPVSPTGVADRGKPEGAGDAQEVGK